MEVTNMAARRKRFFLVLPLVALPFSCLLFYAMGGGKSTEANETKTAGLNTLLPSPQVEEGNPLDKMSLYRQADEDSLKQKKAQQDDPFFSFGQSGTQDPDQDLPPDGSVTNPFSSYSPSTAAGHTRNPDEQVLALQRKLAGLQQLVDQQAADTIARRPPEQMSSSETNPELQRLEGMMAGLVNGAGTEDKELTQMNGMLEKILDIQHPQRVNERLKERSAATQGEIIPVLVSPAQPYADYFGKPATRSDTGHHGVKYPTRYRQVFYGAQQPAADTVTSNTAIEAVVHENQTIVSGSTIKIRLQQAVYVAGRLIPKGAFIFGTCSLNGERLLVDISSLRDNNLLFPVKLSAFDFDGNPGIRIPGSISRDASKQAADQAIQSVAMSTLDPSLGAQAASAGIETAKSLLSKKVRLIRVTVKADYPVLLKSPTY